MATNPIGIGKAVVSASVPQALADEIMRRAKKLKWSKSKYAGELLEKWYAEGCPSVIPADVAPSPVYPFAHDKLAAFVAEAAVAGAHTANPTVAHAAALALQALKDRAEQEAIPPAGKANPAPRK